MKTYYAVLCLQKVVAVNGVETDISTTMGAAGFLPVFRTKKYAEDFSGKKFEVIPIEVKEGK